MVCMALISFLSTECVTSVYVLGFNYLFFTLMYDFNGIECSTDDINTFVKHYENELFKKFTLYHHTVIFSIYCMYLYFSNTAQHYPSQCLTISAISNYLAVAI